MQYPIIKSMILCLPRNVMVYFKNEEEIETFDIHFHSSFIHIQLLFKYARILLHSSTNTDAAIYLYSFSYFFTAIKSKLEFILKFFK